MPQPCQVFCAVCCMGPAPMFLPRQTSNMLKAEELLLIGLETGKLLGYPFMTGSSTQGIEVSGLPVLSPTPSGS